MKSSFNGLLEPVFVYFFFINRDEDGGWLAAGDGLSSTGGAKVGAPPRP